MLGHIRSVFPCCGSSAEAFRGMKRFHVRNEVVKALKEKGLYVEQKDNEMQIPICA